MTTNLTRVRWGIRGVLALGLVASTAANVLHANDNLVSQVISAWPVVALYLTIEVIPRVPVHRRSLAVTRLLAAAVIAGIAAFVSYWHMVGVAARYGETGVSPYLLPLSVDGLIVVASICLVELGGRIRAALEENGESDGPGREGAEVGQPHRAASEARQERSGIDGEGSQGDQAGEEVADADRDQVDPPRKPPRKRPPTSEAAVLRGHKKWPGESNAQLAERLKLSVPTVKRWRPKPAVDTTQINGRDPELVGAGNDEKEN